MSDRTKELLAVLDLPEKEQREWVETHCEMEGCSSDESTDELNIWVITESLADLAFRLRDEATGLNVRKWSLAKKIVYEYVCRRSRKNVYFPTVWFSTEAQPIHWIIASLIAKELAK